MSTTCVDWIERASSSRSPPHDGHPEAERMQEYPGRSTVLEAERCATERQVLKDTVEALLENNGVIRQLQVARPM
jgi:hypothetical protein